MIKAAIFDVDGTLVDSVEVHARTWHDAFAKFGHDIDMETLRGQIGKGGDHLIPEFLSDDEQKEIAKPLEARRAEILKERYLSTIKPFPHVRQLFLRILGAGQRIALASSAKGDELQHYKAVAAIGDLLDTETSSSEAEHSKPDSDIFTAALHRLNGISPSDAIVIGDTPYDTETAVRAGLSCIGFLCSGWSEEDLRSAGCTECYADVSDLLQRFDSSALCADQP